MRWSETNRGWRLHSTSRNNAFKNVREAIKHFMKIELQKALEGQMDKNKQLESFPIVFLNFKSGCFTLFDDLAGAIKAGEVGFQNKGDYFVADLRNSTKLQTKIKQLEAENQRLDYLHKLDHSLADLWQKKNEQLEVENQQLRKQRSFLISCIKSGEQLSDDWEKALEGK